MTSASSAPAGAGHAEPKAGRGRYHVLGPRVDVVVDEDGVWQFWSEDRAKLKPGFSIEELEKPDWLKEEEEYAAQERAEAVERTKAEQVKREAEHEKQREKFKSKPKAEKLCEHCKKSEPEARKDLCSDCQSTSYCPVCHVGHFSKPGGWPRVCSKGCERKRVARMAKHLGMELPEDEDPRVSYERILPDYTEWMARTMAAPPDSPTAAPPTGPEFQRHPVRTTELLRNPHNMRLALGALDVSFWLDAFNDQGFVVTGAGSPRPLSDSDLSCLRFEIERRWGILFEKELFQDYAQDLAFRDSRHPLRAYLDGLTWDGTDRIDRWLTTYFGAKSTDYTSAVGRCWLVAAAKRALEPGSKFDELLLLESPQGYGKSEGLRALCPNPGWFSDSLPLGVDAKTVVERTRGVWIAEIGEMQGMRQRDVEHVKVFLSAQVDGPVRLAYGRVPVRVPRSFVCVGTTNPSGGGYLEDSTGNRRFWPVAVGHAKLAEITSDRDQLWAEAVAAVKAGESIRLNQKWWAVAAVEQEHRKTEDPWFEVMRDALGEATAEESFVTAARAWRILGKDIKDRKHADNRRFGDVMRRLGYERGIQREQDDDTGKYRVCRGWERPASKPIVVAISEGPVADVR